jgi:hypothetical protein
VTNQERVTIAFVDTVKRHVGPPFRFSSGQAFCFPDRAAGGYHCQYIVVRPSHQKRLVQVISNGRRSLRPAGAAVSEIPITYFVRTDHGSWTGTLNLQNIEQAGTLNLPATLQGRY